jgi:DNA recombination protein RmuC
VDWQTLATATLAVALCALMLRLRRQAPAAGLEVVSAQLARVQAELDRLARHQEQLRQDVQRGREASLLQLSEAAHGLRGEIGDARRALAEVKAIEAGRARQMDRAADSLRRLEAVLAGSASRGAAGENILERALAQLPPDLLETNVPFGSRLVEYALRLPGGRYLPIDSKWTSVAALDRLETLDDPLARRRLREQVARELRGRIRELVKYLDPGRTLGLALLAVPDAVYAAAVEAHADGYRMGVVVVPYSLALPYALALYRLTLRFGAASDADHLAERLRRIDDALRGACDEIEGRFSRSLVQLDNSRQALRDGLTEALRASGRLLQSQEDAPAAGGPPGGPESLLADRIR